MDLSNTPNQQRTADPAYLKLHRMLFAVCLLLAPLALSLWFGLCPEYGNPACPVGTSATLVAFRAANPLLLQLFFELHIAYGTGLGLLQVLGYVLVFVGSVPAALAMLKIPSNESLRAAE
jgi:hypothetical protein